MKNRAFFLLIIMVLLYITCSNNVNNITKNYTPDIINKLNQFSGIYIDTFQENNSKNRKKIIEYYNFTNNNVYFYILHYSQRIDGKYIQPEKYFIIEKGITKIDLKKFNPDEYFIINKENLNLRLERVAGMHGKYTWQKDDNKIKCLYEYNQGNDYFSTNYYLPKIKKLPNLEYYIKK